MINNYDPNFRGDHVIRVTFMQWNYVGHVAFIMGGNCHGATLLECSFLEYDAQEQIDQFVENDCKFKFDEDEEIFTAELTNAAGDTLITDGNSGDFERMVVSIEFSELRKPEEE